MTRGLLRFPNPVNEISVRITAGAVLVLAALALALQSRWLLIPLAYGFAARAAAGPTLSPLAQVVTRLVTPRLPLEPRYVPGPPKRFAQTVGAAVTASALAVAFVAGFGPVVDALLAALVLFAALESILNLCVGCKVFAALMRLRVIPEAVCRECADVTARAR